MKFLLILLLLFQPLFARHDSGIWLLYFLEKKVGEKDRLIFWDQFRFRDHMRHLHFWALEGIWYHRFTPLIEFGPGYRESWDNADGRVVSTHLPYLVLLATFEENWGILSTRNRFEYRKRDGEKGRFVYRNRIEYQLALKKCKKFIPFISDEIFWGETRGIFENRLIVGLNFQLTKRLLFSPQYISRLEKAPPTWIQTDIIGLSGTYSF